MKRLADSVRKTAESQYNEIKKIMPVSFSGKITVRIALSLREYESLQPEGHKAPVWSVGIAYPAKNLIVLRGDATHGPDEILRTFRHELAHIFLHNYSDKKIPKWFSEGFSMYFEDEGGLIRSFKLMRQAFSNGYIDIDTLEEDFPDNPVDVQNAYLTSSEFFSFMLSRIGEEGLYKVFENVGQGMDFRYAIYKVSGKTVSEMENEFRKSTRFRYGWVPVITSSTTLWVLLTFLFIYVFIIKKRRSEKRLELMRLEENLILLKKFDEEKREDEDGKGLIN
ncbi:MAG: peptidase MA family metallohydrolase [Deltaproteobacteria bacterium]|nr:peptidase MA family metallohydrolase [Deltaproteobacteria bacterium]